MAVGGTLAVGNLNSFTIEVLAVQEVTHYVHSMLTNIFVGVEPLAEAS